MARDAHACARALGSVRANRQARAEIDALARLPWALGSTGMMQRTRAMGMSTVTTTLALLESDQVWSGGVSLRAKWGRFQSKPAWTELGSTSEVQSIVADYEKEMARGRQIGHDWLISSCCCEHPISGSAIFGACVHIRVGKFDVEQTTLAHRSISAPVTGRLLAGIGQDYRNYILTCFFVLHVRLHHISLLHKSYTSIYYYLLELRNHTFFCTSAKLILKLLNFWSCG